jgi:RNA-directed DNA polymerase
MSTWHRINWAARYRQVRSLQRRIVQAVQAGVWRKVKRLSYLLVHSFAARALAVKRVTENTGKKTPGVDGELWDSPEKKADAVARIGRWQGYRPAPLKRIYIPKKNGQQRPLSIPTLADRARQAVYLQALQPIAETTADPDFDPSVDARTPSTKVSRSCGRKPRPPGSWKGTFKGFSITLSLHGWKRTSPCTNGCYRNGSAAALWTAAPGLRPRLVSRKGASSHP